MQTGGEGHRRLALWCQSQKLDEQATAHWHAVLTFSPNDAQARKALNHSWINGYWFTPEERQRVAEASHASKPIGTKWMPRLQKIVDNIVSPSIERTKRGLAVLEKIDDPEAISSLEITCRQLPDDHAFHSCRLSGEFNQRQLA